MNSYTTNLSKTKGKRVENFSYYLNYFWWEFIYGGEKNTQSYKNDFKARMNRFKKSIKSKGYLEKGQINSIILQIKNSNIDAKHKREYLQKIKKTIENKGTSIIIKPKKYLKLDKTQKFNSINDLKGKDIERISSKKLLTIMKINGNIKDEGIKSKILTAYRKLTLKYHPNKGGNEELFKLLGQVKDKLEKNASKRTRTNKKFYNSASSRKPPRRY